MKNSIFTKNFDIKNYSLSKKLIFLILVAATSILNTKAQNVNIPDANFKAYLLGNSAINTNGDTEIQVSEASSFSGTIGCGGLGINNLTGIEAFTALTALHCHSNNLTSLNVTNNVNLEDLYCPINSINNLDLTNNINLLYLSCPNNSLSSLDLANNISLIELNCPNNSISSLDLTNNTNLTYLRFDYNNFSNLNVSNGNNTNFTYFNAIGNPNLTCIQVDDSANSTANWTLIDATVSFSENCSGSACTVNIPDANFKAYLVGNTAINTNGNTEIECSEASAFNGTIQCSSLNISDMTGLEAFTSLITLWCNDNGLSNLNISGNTSLKSLYCYNNQLSALDLSQNDSIEDIDCSDNNLTSIDVSQNLFLETLGCDFNDITNITFGQNSDLRYFVCYGNPISSLDLQNLTALQVLKCHQTNISSLSLTNNVNLLELQCNTSDISALDLSANINLYSLECSFNQITNLDLNNNSALVYLACAYNDLNVLKLKNGNNSNVTFFQIINNPNLNCIEVDDSIYSTTNWTNIDVQHNFSENCEATTPILVNSITVQGQGGVSTITTNGGTLQMEATVLPANADDPSYTWSVVNGTGSATIDVNGLLTATADGTVNVVATANDASGTMGTKTITISNQSVGINNLALENLSVYPNPSSGVIHIKTNETLTNIKLMDLTGKNIKIFSAEDKTIDISEFDFGIYFLEVANEKYKSLVKIIKK